jgi:hypothetical protein
MNPKYKGPPPKTRAFLGTSFSSLKARILEECGPSASHENALFISGRWSGRAGR